MVDEEAEEQQCAACGAPLASPEWDQEPTEHCHSCAHEIAEAVQDRLAEATAAERARIVAIAREMAAALVDRSGCEMDAFVDGEVRKALLALVERIG